MSTIESLPTQTDVGNYFIANYPPFSTWNSEEIQNYTEVLSKAPAPGPLALYVHLPFCRHRCHYCYFRVYPRRSREDIDRYIDSVLREYSLYLNFPAVKGRPIKSVYFGGGSPSYLEPDQIQRLLGGLQKLSNWKAVEECTFECEPGTVTPEKLKILKQCGVTRLSMGFQSLNDEVLRRSGRDVLVEDCLRAYRQAREAGFKEINIDLLVGLAGESQESWRKTMEQVLALCPDCITIYQLELTHNSTLYASIKSGRNANLASWPAKREWTGKSFELCEKAGYAIGSGYMAIRNPKAWRFIYTVEHFWHGADLVALGETSFGHIHGVHYQNFDTFDRYVQSLDEGKLPVRRALKLSTEEQMRREVILQLKTGSLDAAYYRKKYQIELVEHFQHELKTLYKRELLEMESDKILLTRKGLLEVDWLLPLFYLPQHSGIRYT